MPQTNNNNSSNYDNYGGMQAILESNCVKIISEGALLLEMPHLWLRDNCPCDACRVTETQEKSFILSDVSADISPSDARISDNTLWINWPDGHQTNFNIEEVLALSSPRHQPPLSWGQNFQPEYFAWTKFLSDDAFATVAIQSFLDFGVIVINKAPQALETLELLAPRLGPIREVLFDRIHNVCVNTHVYNIAHTPLALPPHNDFASYSFPPSAQALHMLENEVEGGRSIIVDAWAVVEKLRQERPDYFEILCRFAVPFREFDEANETYAVEPMIKCDTAGRISSVRFSNQLMQTMDPMMEGVSAFYQAYHELCVRITDPMQRCTFRLEGGQILLVAAHRVLHAREAFTPSGKRHLQDAYFELDNIANKIVQLKRKSEVTLV